MADSTHIDDPSRDEVVATVRDFVMGASDRSIGDQENIFETGFVTSLFGIQLIAFLEERYPIVIEDDDLDIANFCSIERIANFVGRKMPTQSAS